LENLKIKQKCEDMIKYGYIALRQFPKSEKFSLAQDIKRTMFGLLEQIIRANRSRDKRETIYAIDTELEILRTQVRLAMELQFLPFAKYEVWGGNLAELGRMIGGWVKSIKG
jgi:four helix bundle protein